MWLAVWQWRSWREHAQSTWQESCSEHAQKYWATRQVLSSTSSKSAGQARQRSSGKLFSLPPSQYLLLYTISISSYILVPFFQAVYGIQLYVSISSLPILGCGLRAWVVGVEAAILAENPMPSTESQGGRTQSGRGPRKCMAAGASIN